MLTCLALLLCLALGELPEGVKVVQNEPTAETVTFDPDDPPADLDLGPDEAAIARFYLYVDLRYQFRGNQKPDPAGVAVRLHSLTFTYTLDLKHTIFLPDNATEKLIEHEDGHRRLGETIVAQMAEPVVAEVIAEVRAKQWTGTGPDAEAAADAAADAMFAVAHRKVLDRLTDEVQRLNDAYDDLTDHGRNGIPTDAAVKKVLLENGYEVGSVNEEG